MKYLNIKRFAGEPENSGGSAKGDNYASNANIKLNEDLKIGESNTSISEILTMKFFFDLFNFETKTFDGAKWLKVYYTNSKSGTVLWKDVDELGCTFQKYKWSILGLLPNFYNSAYGGYEFLYESVTEGKYNRWSQTSDPLLTTNSVSGLNKITTQLSGNGWGGMALSTTKGTSTIMDGSPGDTTWWYAIGQQVAYQNGIPGGAAVTQEVYMWVRIG